MALKAKTKGQKRKNRGGRPLDKDAIRTPSGQKSRSIVARTETEAMARRLALEAATWRRRRMNPSLTVEEARKQEHGSVIHAWRAAHERFIKKHGEDAADPMMFTEADLETARQIHEAYFAYRAAIASRNPRSSSDFTGPGGFDGSNPFEEGREKRDRRAIDRWVGTDGRSGMRGAILGSGHMGMMAVEAIIFENKPIDKLIGDLRLALNAVDRLSRISKAA